MNPHANQFIKKLSHPLRFKFFLFWKLPSAFFSGLAIRQLNTERAEITVPYKWFSQNPFRSTYFACLSMAAEMSTGLLALAQIYKRKPSVSMLVVKMESHFIKKATCKTIFTCEAGNDFERIIDECCRTGEAHTYVSTATGRNEKGELIAEFFITWSFKARVNQIT